MISLCWYKIYSICLVTSNMIFSFMSSHSFNTLFIETNLSWLISESINVLEINTNLVSNLVFTNNNIISSNFFLFFLIIDLYFLIIAVIAQIFIPTEEFAMPAEIPIIKAKAKMETHPH